MKSSTITFLVVVWITAIGVICTLFSFNIDNLWIMALVLAGIWGVLIPTNCAFILVYRDERHQERVERGRVRNIPNRTYSRISPEDVSEAVEIIRAEDVQVYQLPTSSSSAPSKATYPDIIPERESSILHKIFWMNRNGDNTTISSISQRVLFDERVVEKSLEVMITHGLVEERNGKYRLTDRALKIFEG